MSTDLIFNSSFDSNTSKNNNEKQSITQILSDYDSLHHNYITMKSTEKFLENLINEPNNLNYDTEEPLSCEEIEEEFTQSKQEFINEIIEFRKGVYGQHDSFFTASLSPSRLQNCNEKISSKRRREAPQTVSRSRMKMKGIMRMLNDCNKRWRRLRVNWLSIRRSPMNLTRSWQARPPLTNSTLVSSNEVSEQDELYEIALQELQALKKESQMKQSIASAAPQRMTPAKRAALPTPVKKSSISQETINELEAQEKRSVTLSSPLASSSKFIPSPQTVRTAGGSGVAVPAQGHRCGVCEI
jgi:hypothetical protein